MNVFDALTLARTKKRTRRMRRLMVTTLCAVLFAILFAGTFLTSGILNATRQIQDVGYNTHYLALATSNLQNANINDVQKSLSNDMDAELRSRKVAVTDAVRQSESYQAELDRRSVATLQAQSLASSTAFTQKVTHDYHATAAYPFQLVPSLLNARGITAQDSDPFLTEQKTVVEHGEQALKYDDNAWRPPMISHIDQAMIQQALQPGQSFSWKPGDPYPVVIPYDMLPKMAGISVDKMTADAKVATYKSLIKRYTGTTLTYCYRNPTAQAQVTAVLQYNKTAQNDKDPKTTPLPIADCTSFDQKKLQSAGIIANPKDPDTPKPYFTDPNSVPVSQVVQVKLVGFIPASGYGGNQGMFASFVSGITSWGSYADPAIMPEQVYRQDPFLARDISALPEGSGADAMVFFDFTTRQEQQRFISTSCETVSPQECAKSQSWVIHNFGNISVAFNGVAQTLRKVLLWVAVVVAAIAGLLVMSTVSKLIADSRKEVAIFQAIGATRLDLVQVYVGYAVLLACNIGVAALVLAGGLTAWLAHTYDSAIATSVAATAGIFDRQLHVNLFGITPLWAVMVIVLLFGIAVVGAVLALFGRRKRSLMQYIKDE